MNSSAKPPSISETHHEHLVRPQHTNAHHTVFGGEVMAWVDVAAATCAMRHCGRAVVTASIDSLHFLAPVKIGWLVCLDAKVNFTSRTSCEVGVRVTAVNPVTSETHHTASAYLTFVALDSNGKPAPIPTLDPQTALEKRRFQEAKDRRQDRLALKERLKKRRADD